MILDYFDQAYVTLRQLSSFLGAQGHLLTNPQEMYEVSRIKDSSLLIPMGLYFGFTLSLLTQKTLYGKMPRMFSVEQFDQSFCPSRYSDLAVKIGFLFFVQKEFPRKHFKLQIR